MVATAALPAGAAEALAAAADGSIEAASDGAVEAATDGAATDAAADGAVLAPPELEQAARMAARLSPAAAIRMDLCIPDSPHGFGWTRTGTRLGPQVVLGPAHRGPAWPLRHRARAPRRRYRRRATACARPVYRGQRSVRPWDFGRADQSTRTG